MNMNPANAPQTTNPANPSQGMERSKYLAQALASFGQPKQADPQSLAEAGARLGQAYLGREAMQGGGLSPDQMRAMSGLGIQGMQPGMMQPGMMQQGSPAPQLPQAGLSQNGADPFAAHGPGPTTGGGTFSRWR